MGPAGLADIQWMPLAQAAQRLGLSWERAWRLTLQGSLHGRQLGNGRWVVSAESIAAHARAETTRSAGVPQQQRAGA